MERGLSFSQSLLYLLCSVLLCSVSVAALSRDDFPLGFIFGAGASAYQVEGAAAEDGRKPSIWDPYCHAGYEIDHSNGDVAADQYHKYKEDIKLMHDTGLDAYRFSIAWPRLIPDGRGAVNAKGLQYYNNFIDELISYGIEPHVTLYHFDLPLAIQEEYSGLLSPKFIDDFTAYADVCFKEFGDRVKNWVTVNEPNVEPLGGYDVGTLPPQRCSNPFGLSNCTDGNSTVEPYTVAHHLLLAHASAVDLYREKYQEKQGGKVGITLLGWWFEPATEDPDDVAAARRMVDFHIGWFMHPLVYGTYPAVMRRNAGSRMPALSEEDSRRVKGSFDFIGFNHYIALYVRADMSQLQNQVRDYMGDAAVKLGIPFAAQLKGPLRNSGSIPPTPWALQKMLDHLKVYYRNPPVMIHENGNAEAVDPANPKITYDDDFRIDFIKQYLEALLLSIRNGSNTQGYFVWSFIDTFEFQFGYTERFGLYGVDFQSTEKTRYQRKSAHWYAKFLGGNELRKSTSEKDTFVA